MSMSMSMRWNQNLRPKAKAREVCRCVGLEGRDRVSAASGAGVCAFYVLLLSGETQSSKAGRSLMGKPVLCVWPRQGHHWLRSKHSTTFSVVCVEL